MRKLKSLVTIIWIIILIIVKIKNKFLKINSKPHKDNINNNNIIFKITNNNNNRIFKITSKWTNQIFPNNNKANKNIPHKSSMQFESHGKTIPMRYLNGGKLTLIKNYV